MTIAPLADECMAEWHRRSVLATGAALSISGLASIGVSAADSDDNVQREGTVDRPADTRVTPDTTAPSGVRIAVKEDLVGLELTVSEQTTGADTAELADGLGNTLTTTDVSGLGPGDTFQIEHALQAGEEYIVLIDADGEYDRGAYNEDPDWPYDGGSFEVSGPATGVRPRTSTPTPS
ncbi:hypothetical protein [Natrinema soli]|uniref:Uncharacterized protein n=1 Tax=Natrinema soli TaxID=1930624 RepID=A0ABD5SVJ4_9EURY|nr:hypothetical protein [Natrinema soli]